MTRKTTLYARKQRAGHGQRTHENPMALAKHFASQFNSSEMARIKAQMHRHYEALRTGTATRVNFAGVSTYCELGLAIERQGVVRGLSEPLTQAEETLKAIKARCDLPTGWKPPVLHWQEMQILTEMRRFHLFQLQQLSYAEYQRAWRDMLNNVQRVGGEVIQDHA
jgi:hypothetical protein